MGLFWAIVFIMIYFLPALVAREKKNFTAILVANGLLGWTVIGWVGTLIWANMKD